MKELLLLVETDDRLKSNILKAALPLHIHVKKISAEEYNKTLLQILEDKPAKDGPAEIVDAAEADPLGQPMIVLCGFSGSRMNLILNAMRKNGAIVPLKAMLTPTNQNWTVTELFREISREHAAMTQAAGKGPQK